MMTEAFNIKDDITLQDALASVGLEKFNTYISCLFLNSSTSFNSKEKYIIQNLVEAIVKQYLFIEKQTLEQKKLNATCDELKLTIKTLQTMLFGIKSEKSNRISDKTDSDKDNDKNIENDSDKSPKEEKNKQRDNQSFDKESTKDSSDKEVPKNDQKRPSRNKIPEHFQRVDILHKNHCNCPNCNTPYVETNMYSYSEELAVKLYIYVLRHKRAKLVPNCKCSGIPQIYTSPKIGSVMYKGKYSNGLINFLLMNKFYMQVPIHRQLTKLFGNYDSQLSESTINGVFKFLHKQVFPQFYKAIKARTLEANHFHADETSWKVFIDKKGKKTFNHWVWIVASENGISYIYDPTRSKSVVLKTFAPDASGIINVDRYASYNALPEKIKRAFCWYHLRRDFVRLARGIPELTRWSLEWLKVIRHIEKLNTKRFEAYSKLEDSGHLSDEFIKLHKRLYKLLTAFYNRATRLVEDNNIHISAQKVLKSLIKHWNGYMVFYEYPFVPMHNNYSERLLRCIANARNNFLGSHSIWSAELMAMVLSICETAKLHGLNPHTYMEYILTQSSLYEDRQIPNIQSVLPWNISSDTLKTYENTQSLIPYIHQNDCNKNTVIVGSKSSSEFINSEESSSIEGDIDTADSIDEPIYKLKQKTINESEYNNISEFEDTSPNSTNFYDNQKVYIRKHNVGNNLKPVIGIRKKSKIPAAILSTLMILFFILELFTNSFHCQAPENELSRTILYIANTKPVNHYILTAREFRYKNKREPFVGLFNDTS